MKRGVIVLNKDEINEIYKRVELEAYTKSPLSPKLRAAIEAPDTNIPIEVSEEELEFVLDEIVIPDPAIDTDATRTLRSKIQELLQQFRSQDNTVGIM